jgi:hypothetical protein
MGPPPPKRPTLTVGATAAAEARLLTGTGTGTAVAAPAGLTDQSRVCLLQAPNVLSEYAVTLARTGQEGAALNGHPAGDLLLTVQNSSSAQLGGPVATITVTAGGAQKWVDMLRAQVCSGWKILLP